MGSEGSIPLGALGDSVENTEPPAHSWHFSTNTFESLPEVWFLVFLAFPALWARKCPSREDQMPADGSHVLGV